MSEEQITKAVEIIERVMTMHWDMAACTCEFCTEARAIGCSPRDFGPGHWTRTFAFLKYREPMKAEPL